jgi:hypothetical protein
VLPRASVPRCPARELLLPLSPPSARRPALPPSTCLSSLQYRRCITHRLEHSGHRPPAARHTAFTVSPRTDWSTPATGHQLQYITLIRDQQTSRKSLISALSCSETCIFSHIVQYAKKMKAVVDEQLPSYICSE